MSLRITGGSLRGRRLLHRTPSGVRPTASRVREALFSIVGQDLRGMRVLDAFGGSGAVTFEAVSRGAEHVVVYDRSTAALRGIRETAAAFGVTQSITVRRGKMPAALPTGAVFDLVFLDPPYAMDPESVVAACLPLASTWLVLEHAQSRGAPVNRGLSEATTHRYGDSALTVFRIGSGGSPVAT